MKTETRSKRGEYARLVKPQLIDYCLQGASCTTTVHQLTRGIQKLRFFIRYKKPIWVVAPLFLQENSFALPVRPTSLIIYIV